MSNMSYCRFENTYKDLAECFNALEGREGLSKSEVRKARQMLIMMVEFLDQECIIEPQEMTDVKERIEHILGECKED